MSKKSGKSKWLFLVMCALVAILPSVGNAATLTWFGGTGAWETAGNWSPAGVPVSWDEVHLMSGTCTISSAQACFASITGWGVADTTTTLDIKAGGSLTQTDTEMIIGYIGNGPNSPGVVKVEGTATLASLRIGGEGTNNYGIMDINNGGLTTVTSFGTYLGTRWDNLNTGVGIVNISTGGTFIIDGQSAQGHRIEINTGSHVNLADNTATMKVMDNCTAYLQGLINAGKIIGYNGTGTVTPVFDGVRTVVTATPTPPKPPATNPNPADKAKNVARNAVLSWTPSPYAKKHDVYLDTNSTSVADANHSSTAFKGSIDPNNYTNPGGFAAGQTYYWRIDEVNDSNVWTGTVWSFSIVPPIATNPNPADGQRRVLLNATTLSWVGDSFAAAYDVYFGTNSTAIDNANHASPEFKGTYGTNSYTVPGAFALGQAYYWRIDEVNNTVVWKGNVWHFTTVLPATMSLRKGVVFDRQYHQIPVESYNVVHPADVNLVKRMELNFVKLLFNPYHLINGSTIDDANMWYVDELVNKFVGEGVPVVVCIHPEAAFKTKYLGNNPAGSFTQLLGFYQDFAAYLAARWDKSEVAFELMTEPYGNYTSWNTMLPQMWQAVRNGMPDNILILDADGTGDIGHLTALNPVPPMSNDPNIYYSFTTYWPWIFTFQGNYWSPGSYYPYLAKVPYPSTGAEVAGDYVMDIPEEIDPDGTLHDAAVAAVNAYLDTPWNYSQHQALFAPITAWRNAHGNPKVFCAEWGVLDANQARKVLSPSKPGAVEADRVKFIKDRRLALEDANISWAYWSFNEAFTLLDPIVRVANAAGPTISWLDNPTLDALGLPLCGCGCKVQPDDARDLNHDCYINILDLAMMAGGWLDCTATTDANCL